MCMCMQNQVATAAAQIRTDPRRKQEEIVSLGAELHHISGRIDKFLARFTRDNMLREGKNMATYPLPQISPGCIIMSLDEAEALKLSVGEEIKHIIKVSFPGNNPQTLQQEKERMEL